MATKFVTGLLALLTVSLFTVPAYCQPIAAYDKVRSSYKSSDAYILDRNGQTLLVVRKDFTVRRLQWVELKDISPSLINAVLLSEDKRFFSHSGVDWLAAGAALFENLRGSSSRGASTITMQLLGFIDRKMRPKGRSRTMGQKLEQARAAMDIEKHWTKGQILESYLNLVYFRGEIQGIGAASKWLLDKSPWALNHLDSAVLAVLIRNPEASLPQVIKRASHLLDQLSVNYETEDLRALVEQALSGTAKHSVRQPQKPPFVLPHLDVSAGGSFRTTLDRELQLHSMESLRRNISQLQAANVNDGAVLVVHNQTGQILAYVGNGGDLSTAPFVDGIRAKRQAGSTLKPFLYALAIEKGLLDSSSVIDDSPVSVYTERGLYAPHNYSDDYKGMVTLRQALASSLNVPAVKTLILLGIEDFHSKLLNLGFELPEGADYYGYSIALGSVDVSLYELVRAYRTLAQGGISSDLTILDRDGGARSKRAFSHGPSFIVSDILSDRGARALTFGLETPIAAGFWAAVKTGTSKDMRDNWCIGYSDTYTVGVWVGNFSGRPMWNVSGISGAAQIWLEVMNYLHRHKKSHPPKAPKDIIARKVFRGDADDGDAMEWFVKKTAPVDGVVRSAMAPSVSRIVYPTEGTIIGLDPDMPEEGQRIFFRIEGYQEGMKVEIGNDSIEVMDGYALWRPVRGSYKAVLKDSKGKTLDEIHIQIRGAVASRP